MFFLYSRNSVNYEIANERTFCKYLMSKFLVLTYALSNDLPPRALPIPAPFIV